MFDGEDALGQVSTMSLDDRRNLNSDARARSSCQSPNRSPAR